jgi:CBS domain-containing protein
MKIEEIMTTQARCVNPSMPVSEAAKLLRDLDIGSLPVCEHDRLVGIITDRDITVRAVAENSSPDATSVRDVMTPGIVYVFHDQDVAEAAQIMEERQIRRLPVVNRSKRLVGIVSIADIALDTSPELCGHALTEISKPHAESSEAGMRSMPAL